MGFDRDDYLHQTHIDFTAYSRLESDCHTPEHQALKHIAYEKGSRALFIDHVPKSGTVNIFADMGSGALRLLAKDSDGPIFITSTSRMFRVRGSLLVDHAQPPEDRYGEAAMKSLIRRGVTNKRQRITISPQLTVPMAYVGGRLIEDGYMVANPVYTFNQYSALTREQKVEIGRCTLSELRLLQKEELIITRQEPVVFPYQMKQIDVTS